MSPGSLIKMRAMSRQNSSHSDVNSQNPIDRALRGKEAETDRNKKLSFVRNSVHEILTKNFQSLYDCFFKIIKDRLARYKHKPDGRIDELMYSEDNLCYLFKPNDQERRRSLRKDQDKFIWEHLYMPNTSTPA